MAVTAVLAASLAAPLVGAVAAVLVRRATWVAPLAAGAAAVGWAVVAAAGEPPTLGRITGTPLVAATAAGAALLVAARPPGTALGASAACCAVTVLAVGASTGDPGLPDRPLGVAVLVVGALTVLVERVRPAPGPGTTRSRRPPPSALAALVVGAGLLASDAALAGPLVAVGATGAVVAAALRAPAAPVLLPVAVLATARVAVADTGAAPTAVAVAAALAGLVAAALLAFGPRAEPRETPLAATGGAGTTAEDGFWEQFERSATARRAPRTSRWAGAPGLAVVAAGLVLATADVPGLRPAGLLLAAGGVLAAAAGHPAALVAALPGLAASLEAFGAATEPVHALAGAAAAALLGAGLRLAGEVPPTGVPPGWLARVPLGLAVLFALVPLWGWSGATPEAYVEAWATAVAVGAVVVALALAARAPTGAPRWPGTLARRPRAATHASSHPLVVEVDEPEALGARGPQGPVRRPRLGSPERPVAVPPRPVPGRAAPGRDGGRGRLRARPGRPA